MNNKAFTLVELLLVISILGLIMGIAVPSYTGISNLIKDNQRKNIIKKIEIAASKYAFDSGKTIIFVDELVTEGYIESDDENGTIKDPVNNKRMNCYIVEMEKNSDHYDAKFIDDTNYDDNGECNTDKLKENKEEISILVDGDYYDGTTWLTDDIELQAHSNNTLVIDCDNNKCVWTSSSGLSEIGSDNISLTDIIGNLENRYTFQYTVFDNVSNEVKRYNASINLKIDKADPIIYNNQITVSDRYIYTDEKTIKIVASDGKGSGIKGYYMAKDINNCFISSIQDNFTSNNTFKITENGIYRICVKDNVNNIASTTINIKYINEG